MMKQSTNGKSYLTSGQITCKGDCIKYKASKPRNKTIQEMGFKRCVKCVIIMKYDGMFCPCCNNKLRSKSRYAKQKNRIEVPRI